MGYFDDSSKHLNELEEAFVKNSTLMNKLGLKESSNYLNTIEVTLKFYETETLLHIADELKRIADLLEKLTMPLNFYEEDKGALKEKENTNDTN